MKLLTIHKSNFLVRGSLAILLSLLGLSVVAAELIISSFNQNGELTWTNPLTASNGTYRVEWSGSPTGAWSSFEALTNLSLISASSNGVTVKVPTFYRIVWLDAPAHAGNYNYSGFDQAGSLIVTGRLTLVAASDRVRGSWDFKRVGPATNNIGPQIGTGTLGGSFGGNYFDINLNPGWIDNNVYLVGRLMSDTLADTWVFEGFGPMARGTFVAERQGGRILTPPP